MSASFSKVLGSYRGPGVCVLSKAPAFEVARDCQSVRSFRSEERAAEGGGVTETLFHVSRKGPRSPCSSTLATCFEQVYIYIYISLFRTAATSTNSTVSSAITIRYMSAASPRAHFSVFTALFEETVNPPPPPPAPSSPGRSNHVQRAHAHNISLLRSLYESRKTVVAANAARASTEYRSAYVLTRIRLLSLRAHRYAWMCAFAATRPPRRRLMNGKING